jgi:hypothetical protein
MRTGVWLLNITLLGMPSIFSPSADSEPRLLYRTADRMTSALAYDVESDAAVELVQLAAYGPSVLRRVSPGGKAGEVIWKTEQESLCPEGYCGGLGLEYSAKLGGYLVRVALGTSNRVPSVYLTQGGGRSRLVARTVIQPRAAYPNEDKLEAGVIGIHGYIDSVTVADETGEVLISTAASGKESPARTYLINAGSGELTDQLEGKIVGKSSQGLFVSPGTRGWKGLETAEAAAPGPGAVRRITLIPIEDPEVTKLVESGNLRAEWRSVSGKVLIRRVNGGDLRGATAKAGVGLLSFTGCGNETDRPNVTGVWVTKRGTFVVAVDQNVTKEKDGRFIYNGVAHCLYEVE